MKNIGTTSPLKMALGKIGFYPPKKVYHAMRYCLCQPGREEELKAILKKYPDAVRWEKQGDMQPVDYAIWQRQLGSAEVLIRADPTILKEASHSGLTPLAYAALNRHQENFDFLLGLGADVQERDDKGNTLLHRLARQSIYGEMAAPLVQAGVDPKAKNDAGDTALIASLRHEGMFRVIAGLDGDFAQTDAKGNGLLHIAAQHGHCPGIDMLVKAGLDIEAKSPEGLTPLDLALARYEISAAARLIEHGADFDPESRALKACLDREKDICDDLQLDWAVEHRKEIEAERAEARRIAFEAAEKAHAERVVASCTAGTADAVAVKKPLQLKSKSPRETLTPAGRG